MRIGTKISVLCTVIVFGLGLAVLLMWLSADRALKRKQQELVVGQAVNVGKTIAQQVAATRAEYAKRVVGGLKPHGVKFSPTPGEGEAPLPATFMSHVSNRLQQNAGKDGASFVLRSGWNINVGQGIQSEFEKKGWNHLVAQEKGGSSGEKDFEPYWERGTLTDGSEVIHVMTADLASAQSCVDCHNKLEQTDEVRQRRAGEPLKQFQLGDLMGAVVTTVPTSESEAAVAGLAQTQSTFSYAIITVIVVGLMGAATASTILGRRVAQPVRDSVESFEAFAAGDLSRRLDESRRDELGDLAKSFNEFAGRLDATVGEIANDTFTLNESSRQLSYVAAELANGATDATQQSGTVAAAAEEMAVNMNNMAQSTADVSDNVKNVARSVDEMTSSINEVAQNAEKSASVAAQAAELVGISNQKISDLGGAADEIGKVIEVIQDIAEQTNLLALNATIEAARAGEAGKGFAVVATEVKELAKQTAAATDDIRRRIEGIQASTGGAVDAIREISDVINNVNEVSRTIAAAVEEQSVTTKQIAQNVSQTASAAELVATGVNESASASQEITQNISKVDHVLRQTAEGAKQSQESGEHFSELASQMQALVEQFKTESGDSLAV